MTLYVSQTAFSRGELSKRIHDRPELDHYKLGLAVARNWIILRHGAICRRPPTEFIAEIADSSDEAKLIPFTFNTDQSYILELTDQNMRVYKDGGVVLDGGSPVDVALPFSNAEMQELDYTQSNDVLYVTHKSYYPRRLTRTSHVDWQLNNISFVDGPYGAKNGTGTEMTPGGSIIANASTSVSFDYTSGINDGDGLSSDDIGRYIRYEHPGESTTPAVTGPTTGQHVAWGQITAVADTTNCTVLWLGSAGIETLSGVTLVNNVHASTHWWLGDFFKADTYPHRCGFYGNRLFFARSNLKPKTLWSSTSGGYETNTPSDKDGSVEDDHAFVSTVTGDTGIEILWLAEGKVLQFGTQAAARIFQSTDGDLVAPDNRKQTRESSDGAADIKPVQIGAVTLYVEFGGRAVREMVYSFQEDSYITPDASILSEHLLKSGVKDWAYAQTPNSTVWIALNNGNLVSLTYERSQQTVGWCQHDVGGDVESVCSIPGDDSTEVWLVVKRTIDGATKRYVERLLEPFDGDLHTLVDYGHLDCQARYSGAAISTVTGLDHLEGETVGIMADGIDIGDAVVSSGEITLPEERSASDICVGLRYASRFTTLTPPIQDQQGSAMGRKRRVTQANISFMELVDMKFGSHDLDDSELQPLFANPQEDSLAVAPDLQEGIERVVVEGSWDDDGRGQLTGLIESGYSATVRGVEVKLEYNP